jgi:hypothetical protein
MIKPPTSDLNKVKFKPGDFFLYAGVDALHLSEMRAGYVIEVVAEGREEPYSKEAYLYEAVKALVVCFDEDRGWRPNSKLVTLTRLHTIYIMPQEAMPKEAVALLEEMHVKRTGNKFPEVKPFTYEEGIKQGLKSAATLVFDHLLDVSPIMGNMRVMAGILATKINRLKDKAPEIESAQRELAALGEVSDDQD